jgi:glycosyltransferase involved in cell wall biosynthesis
MNQIPLSAFMITFNNVRTVERAIQSLRFADEILVVDSFSTDGTLDIVKRYATKIVQRPWPGFRDQYQFAAEACTHDWVTYADADEEVTSALAGEMRAELERNAGHPAAEQVCGYDAHRRTWYLGRWILHGGWAPVSDCEIRLYNRRTGRWLGDLHATTRISGRTAHLQGMYNHYSYANISDQLRKIDQYSDTAAADKMRNGKRFSYLCFLVEPWLRFLRDYIVKLGFLDGLPGLVIAVNTMFYTYVKHAKLWELERRR